MVRAIHDRATCGTALAFAFVNLSRDDCTEKASWAQHDQPANHSPAEYNTKHPAANGGTVAHRTLAAKLFQAPGQPVIAAPVH